MENKRHLSFLNQPPPPLISFPFLGSISGILQEKIPVQLI